MPQRPADLIWFWSGLTEGSWLCSQTANGKYQYIYDMPFKTRWLFKQTVHTSVVSGTEIFQALAWMPAKVKSNISIMPMSKVGTTRGGMLLKYLHSKYFPNFLNATTLQTAMMCDYHLSCCERRQQKIRNYIHSFLSMLNPSGNSYNSFMIPELSPKHLSGLKSRVEEKTPKFSYL